MTKEKDSQITSVVYIGKGGFLHGIPARNLTIAEFEVLPSALQDAVKKSGLYVFDKEPVNE